MEAGPRALLVITGAFQADGGIAAVNRLAIRALAEADFRLDVLSLGESDATVDGRYVETGRAAYRVFGGRKAPFVLAVWRALLSRRHDLVLSDHVNVASALAPGSRLGLCQYAVWLHGTEVFPPRPDWQGLFGLRHASRRLVTSDYTRRSVGERYPNLPLCVCDLALDPVRHAADLPEQPQLPEAPVALEALDGARRAVASQAILHVGRLDSSERYKGQESLLLAFPAVYARFPDAQLLIVGQGGDLPRLRALGRTLPPEVQRRVFMPGYVDDALLARLYGACFAFAMPSLGEGFGLVYLEAMSRAKPCLGAKAQATTSVIQEGVTGLLIEEPRVPQAVAAAVNWLLERPALARDMGLAGYRLVRSRYLFHHFQQRFWQALAA